MKVVIALSGGVDSSVAAWLLKEKGYEVIGVHMRNWDSTLYENRDECSGREDYLDVKRICDSLNIPLYIYNFAEEYWENVFCPYIHSLSENLNTNPDVRCNSFIKFGALLNEVLKEFGDVKLATGHWAKVTEEKGRFFLDVCSNYRKDQTYFLSGLRESQLSRVIFPLSDFSSKEEVREIAKRINIPVWNKRDSVGICFIGKRNYRDFIGNYIEDREGDLVDIDTGEVLGRHKGTHLYVLHQRDGLFLKGYDEKYYVCGKDVRENIVYLCKRSMIEKHLYKTTSRCENLHWISDDFRINVGEELYVKVRHSPDFLSVKVLELGDDYCLLEHKSMYVTTPGQTVAFYKNRSRCLGSGIYVSVKSTV